MNDIITYLQGKKTYILAVAVVVYAALAYFKVVPEPNEVAGALVVIAGFAVTLRAALAAFVKDVGTDV